MLKKIALASCIALISNFTSAEYKEGADITTYLNDQLRVKSNVKVPAGNYKINADESIVLRDNVSLTLGPKTTFTVIPNKNGKYQVFKIHNVKNVKISGGTLIGDKYTHLGNTGEWGMGIEIKDSQNISISNMSINKMWGDAIYIGTNGKNSTYGINLSNIKMNDNRRQGISIISVDTLIARNISASNTSGTKPASGIDIEPNDGSMLVKNIQLENIITSGNEGSGIQIGLSRYSHPSRPVSISIKNHKDIGSQYGLLIGSVNPNPSGFISMSALDYSNFSCLNYWNNSKFNIKINGNIGSAKIKKCMGYLNNPSISLNK